MSSVCSSVASPTNHKCGSSYFTIDAGTSRHSPLPSETPSAITTAPNALNQPRTRGVGADGNSSSRQGSSPECASGDCDSGATVSITRGLVIYDSPLFVLIELNDRACSHQDRRSLGRKADNGCYQLRF